MSGVEARERLRDFWLPALVGLGGALICLVLWALLVADRREQLLAVASETALETRLAVEAGLEAQVGALQGLQDLWGAFGVRRVEESQDNVARRLAQIDGLQSVTWIDLDEPGARITVGAGGAIEAIEIDDQTARARSESPRIEGPHRDSTGAVGYRVFLPVRISDDHAGVLIGRFQLTPFLESVVSARARGYGLSVLWGEQEVFSRGVPSPDPLQQWWRVEERIALPLGGSWRIVHRPTREFAALHLTPLPHYLLAAGVVLSLVLAVAAYQLRLIVRQARFLAASNRALEQRGAELESRVAERTEALRDAITELEAFNYSVSHDLRSPLGAILNLTAILNDDYRAGLDPGGRDILVRIRRSAERGVALLEDLLRLSRTGSAVLEHERIDMTALAREAFAQARACEERRDLEFIVEPLPEAWGDRALLGDVFANLFSNALKYSRGREKPRITVSGRVERGECIYEVADNGDGFDMQYADKLFGLFQRLHADGDVEGTGVGLAIVARILKRHGGRVWAEGRLEAGARFSFALPIREAA